MMLITGVMPEPPASSSRSCDRSLGVNVPDGASTSISSPALIVSHTKLEPRPSTTRLTVTLRWSSTPGAEDSE